MFIENPSSFREDSHKKRTASFRGGGSFWKKSKERMLRPHGPDLADQLVVLKVNLGIQAKTFADGLDGGRFRREGVGHVLAGGEMVGFIGEFTAAYVLGGGDVGAFFLHRGGYGID